MKLPYRKAVPGGGRAERGSAIVELALVIPWLLLLLFAAIELGVMFWVNITMQHAVREGARYAVTGQKNLDPATASQQRYLAVIESIKNNSMGLYDSVSTVISVNNASYNDASSYNASMFGGPGDTLVLRLDCTWTFATPLMTAFFTDGAYHFSVAATMRNEVFE